MSAGRKVSSLFRSQCSSHASHVSTPPTDDRSVTEEKEAKHFNSISFRSCMQKLSECGFVYSSLLIQINLIYSTENIITTKFNHKTFSVVCREKSVAGDEEVECKWRALSWVVCHSALWNASSPESVGRGSGSSCTLIAGKWGRYITINYIRVAAWQNYLTSLINKGRGRVALCAILPPENGFSISNATASLNGKFSEADDGQSFERKRK